MSALKALSYSYRTKNTKKKPLSIITTTNLKDKFVVRFITYEQKPEPIESSGPKRYKLIEYKKVTQMQTRKYALDFKNNN